VQHEQARRRVKARLNRQHLHRATDQRHPLSDAERLGFGLSEGKHVVRGIDAGDMPARIPRQETLDLHPTTGANDQEMKVRSALRAQEALDQSEQELIADVDAFHGLLVLVYRQWRSTMEVDRLRRVCHGYSFSVRFSEACGQPGE
jgi:hypothetical protein